jgi:hypothetical protein
MDAQLKDSLARIEAQGRANAAILEAQGELLTIVLRQLTQIAELLTPRDNDGGVPLDELLAHMIRQNDEQLRIARGLLDALQKLERNLPPAVVAALKGDRSLPA